MHRHAFTETLMIRIQRFNKAGLLLCLLFVVPAMSWAQQGGALSGSVVDTLGARVPGAAVSLVPEQGPTREVTADGEGAYTFTGLAAGRYLVTATAPGFATFTSQPVFVGANASITVDATLEIGRLTGAVVVTASAASVRQSQTGAPVTVIDAETLQAQNKPDLLEALRLVPGTQVEQSGGRGGTTGMYIRGGGSSFAKVLIDGVSANDIGGAFDFAQLQTTGVDRIEVLRQSNSVVYGSDALTGVVSIETRRGRTRVPEATLSLDGGNLGTFRSGLSGGGAVGRFDYFSEYSYFSTDNKVPNNAYNNHSYAGRFGVALGGNTDLNGTIRSFNTELGSPNGILLYGVADDSSQAAKSMFAGVTAQSQWTDRLQSLIRVTSMGSTSEFLNPTPTGTPFDPFGFGTNYVGNTVTITGANGYSATGRAILDFDGVFPSLFRTRTTRRGVFGQTTYMIGRDVFVSGGGRFEREHGYDDPDGDPSATRNNGGAFVEARGSIGGRTYVSAGVGYERNAVFKSATTPRVSVATYLRQPSAGPLGDTKVTFNAGKAIKAPSVFQSQSSLFELVQGTPAEGTAEAIGPERSRSVDVGIEQGFAGGQARVRVSYFDNRFEDLIEFVNKSVLPQLGVPPDVAQATPFGANVNSSSYTARGVETSAEALMLGSRLRLMASYTFTDAEVTESFAGGALAPAVNPAFPDIQIGAFSPLVGQRPFRRPTHAGTFLASYAEGPATVTLSMYMSGKRDGSTFLSDEFFGNSMLLPNKDLEAAYQKVDLAGSYRLHRSLRAYLSIENVLNRDYQSAFGFPALPLAARGGVTVSFGGQ